MIPNLKIVGQTHLKILCCLREVVLVHANLGHKEVSFNVGWINVINDVV